MIDRRTFLTIGGAAAATLALPRAAVASTPRFSDVPADATHHPAIEWAAKEGLVNGRADGTFGPHEPVTRAQLVAILSNQAHA